MGYCRHSKWLHEVNIGDKYTLTVSNRLEKLVQQIPDRYNAKPSLIVLIGEKAKSQALRQLFNIKQTRLFRNQRYKGEVHLNLYSDCSSPGPLLVADGRLGESQVPKKHAGPERCHQERQISIPNDTIGGTQICRHDITSVVYQRLLFPFADVFCLFANDLGGLRDVARQLACLSQKPNPSTLAPKTFPQILVVTSCIAADRDDDLRGMFLYMFREESQKDFNECFPGLDIVSIGSTMRFSSGAQYRSLKERILGMCSKARQAREDHRVHFSAEHMRAYFSMTCDHICKTIEDPFDFILSSRVDGPRKEDLSNHLSHLVGAINDPQTLINFGIPLISSCLLMDSYPPDAHGEYAVYLFIHKSATDCIQYSVRLICFLPCIERRVTI